MSLVYLCLGSNLGQREDNFRKAIILIEEKIGSIKARSAFHETFPWGYDSTNKFLNACIAVETTIRPQDCLLCLKDIERSLGRIKSANTGYSDRVIDIDILLYDDLVMESPDLTIPHPLMHERYFVLKPLSEIASDLVHPILKKNIRTLLVEISSKP
jgi:2-amino-4-hydroxy-6-hydroxymethyldihydropteridine diphosphokinase